MRWRAVTMQCTRPRPLTLNPKPDQNKHPGLSTRAPFTKVNQEYRKKNQEFPLPSIHHGSKTIHLPSTRLTPTCCPTLYTMPSASLLVLLLVVCSVHQIRGSLVGNGDAPWFCHDLDCPKFKVLETKDKYEVREYEKGLYRFKAQHTAILVFLFFIFQVIS